MAHICRGIFFVHFGASFITSLLQTGASLKESLVVPIGKRVPLVGEMIITASFRLVFSSMGNMERQDIRAEL